MVRKLVVLALAASTAFCLSSPAVAGGVTDPTGDFLSTYTGPPQADLDVTSFGVTFDSVLNTFLLHSTMAGTIDPTLGGFYIIGANTGTGPSNFASIGLPGVTFNQVIRVNKDGTATIGANSLAPGSVVFDDNAFSVTVPLALLPSTGFTPDRYGFNIWPRSASTPPPGQPGTAVISDFAPDNSTVSAAPEPATWALMILGFGLTGVAPRRRNLVAAVRRRRDPLAGGAMPA